MGDEGRSVDLAQQVRRSPRNASGSLKAVFTRQQACSSGYAVFDIFASRSWLAR